jgi:hypothetical protein
VDSGVTDVRLRRAADDTFGAEWPHGRWARTARS